MNKYIYMCVYIYYIYIQLKVGIDVNIPIFSSRVFEKQVFVSH